MLWHRCIIAHTEKQMLLKTIKICLLQGLWTRPVSRDNHLLKGLTLYIEGQTKCRVKWGFPSTFYTGKLSPEFLCHLFLSLKTHTKAKILRGMKHRLARLSLCKMAQQTLSAKQNISDGNPTVTHTKKKEWSCWSQKYTPFKTYILVFIKDFKWVWQHYCVPLSIFQMADFIFYSISKMFNREHSFFNPASI